MPEETTTNPRQDSRNAPRRNFRRNFKREVPEFEHRVVDVRRVTRVMAGGRRFRFSVVVIAGDRKGRVGVGIGKASDTSLAIEKALNDAKKRMVKIKRSDDGSIPHEVEHKFQASQVLLRPAPGKGLVAGSSARVVLDLAGISHASVKFLSRSKNKLNNARATMGALQEFVVKK